MNIALISGAYPRREVVARGVSHKLNGDTVQPFSCIEDVLESSMDYDVFVVYNNFEKKMNGVDGTREIRRLAPHALIVGVSAIPYMERQFLPAGADVFLMLAGNEIAELGELLIKNRNRVGAPRTAPTATAASAPASVTSTTAAPNGSHAAATAEPAKTEVEATDPLLATDHMIYTLERTRLLLDYALSDPDPADLRRYGKAMMAEIERIITRYYATHPHSDNGQRAPRK